MLSERIQVKVYNTVFVATTLEILNTKIYADKKMKNIVEVYGEGAYFIKKKCKRIFL